MPAKLSNEELKRNLVNERRRAARAKRRALEKAMTVDASLSHVKLGGKAGPPKSMAAARASLLDAFELLGGTAGLVLWGRSHPKEFYALWGRMLPKAEGDAPAESLEALLAKLDEKRAGDIAEAVASGAAVPLHPANKVSEI